MVRVKTADGVHEDAFKVTNGRVTAPIAPFLGTRPRLQVLGDPIDTYN